MPLPDTFAGLPPDTINRLGPIMASVVKPLIPDELMDRLIPVRVPPGWLITDRMHIPGGIVEFLDRIPESPMARLAADMQTLSPA